MTTLIERREHDASTLAPARPEPTSAGDVWNAFRQKAIEVDNSDARMKLMIDAYDRRIESIYQATGQRFDNPIYRLPKPGEDVTPETIFKREADFRADFMRSLGDLAKNRPEHRAVIRPDLDPAEDARERARKADKTAAEAFENYRGPWGLGTAAMLGGGMWGMLHDPMNVVTLPLGPWGRAGPGLSGLAWMAVKQGAANAIVEAALQPGVARWKIEAGLGYDVSDFAKNVGMAGVLGAGLDFGVRGGYRAVQSTRGRVPLLDIDGNVRGWGTKEEALDAAAVAQKVGDLRAARDGDPVALRKLAREVGIDQRPEMRALLDTLDSGAEHDTRLPGVHAVEHDRMIEQIARALDDPLEPMPQPPAPLRDARGVSLADERLAPGSEIVVDDRRVHLGTTSGDESGRALWYVDATGKAELLEGSPRAGQAAVLREADGWTRDLAEVEAARKALHDGRLEPVQAALLMRERPEIVDASLPMEWETLQAARSLARLEDRAFDLVTDGRADPRLAAIVSDHVPDRAQQASILERLTEIEPENEVAARKAIRVLYDDPERPRPRQLVDGIDEPSGVAGELQIKRLEQLLADEIAVVEGRAKPSDIARAEDQFFGGQTGKQARDLVLDGFARTGNEHGAIVLPDGTVREVATSGQSRTIVEITPSKAPELFEHGDRLVSFHHNHPSGRGFSRSDMGAGMRLASLREAFVHTADSGSYRVEFIAPPGAFDGAAAYQRASDILFERLRPMVDDGRVEPREASLAHPHMIMQMLDQAGLVRYEARAPEAEAVAGRLLAEMPDWSASVAAIKKEFGNAIPDRRADTVRSDGGVAGAPAAAREGQDAVAGRNGGNRDGEGANPQARGGLAGPVERVTQEALDEAPDASLRVALAEVDGLERMALIMETCKL